MVVGNGKTPVFLPGWAAVYGVTQSRTRLKQLSSSSCLKPLNFGVVFHSAKANDTVTKVSTFVFTQSV